MNLIFTLIIVFTICECRNIDSISYDDEKSLENVCRTSVELMSTIFSQAHDIWDKIYHQFHSRLIDHLRKRFPSTCEAAIQNFITRIDATMTSVDPSQCFQHLDPIIKKLLNQIKDASRLITQIKASDMNFDDRNLMINLENQMNGYKSNDLKREYNLTELCWKDFINSIETKIHRIQASSTNCANLINFHITFK